MAKALTLVTQLGISMFVPIFLCLFIGLWLDKTFGTSPVFLLLFILIGIYSGFRGVYNLTRSFFKNKDTYSVTSVKEALKAKEKGGD